MLGGSLMEISYHGGGGLPFIRLFHWGGHTMNFCVYVTHEFPTVLKI